VNLIAIDSCSSVLSIALSFGNETLYSETEEPMKHSELVIVMMDEAMKKASVEPSELHGVLCMGGPGSFTGLRIGYSIAKGLALSLSIPFFPVPTLECIAYSKKDHPLVLAVLEARKNAYFYAFFKNNERISQDKDALGVQITEEIKSIIDTGTSPILLTGPGASLLYNSMPEQTQNRISLDIQIKGYARELIAIALNNNILKNDCEKYLYSGPEYIRETDAQLALNSQVR